jgi:hypothetical protein
VNRSNPPKHHPISNFNDLVVGTYGRGYWILGGINPLQQLTADIAERPAHLFEP